MSEIVLAPQQLEAYDAIGKWLSAWDSGDHSQQVFILHGLAGTGKTSIAKKLSGQHDGPVYPMAYTGKAASVLRSKGFLLATTIHGKIYLPANEQQEEAKNLEEELAAGVTEKRERQIRRRLEELYSPEFVRREYGPGMSPVFSRDGLIVLDECSMVSSKEGNDLKAFGIPILVLGDPGQLPPIEGRGFFNNNPDFVLTEIHRQAAENPILHLAMRAREGKPISFGQYGTSSVIRKREITKELVFGVDQIICGKNDSRRQFNREFRQLKGYEGTFPRQGEKVICLRNNRDFGIFNGEFYEMAEDAEEQNEKYISFSILDEGKPVGLNVHRACFEDPDVLKSWSYERRKPFNEFDFGWACTIHKFQGSQAKRVLVVPDNMFVWDQAQRAKLLYTGLTRAEDSVVLAL